MTHKLEKQHCPACNHTLDAATNAGEGKGCPEPNDVTICIECLVILKFDQELRLLRLTVDEFVDLDVDIKRDLLAAIEMLKSIKNKN